MPGNLVLELDPRTTIEAGERIWFHDKDGMAAEDYEIVEGYVQRATPMEYEVVLDREIHLQSQSGSPVISQSTGKVIGTLSAGNRFGGRLLFLAPSCAILKALTRDDDFPRCAT